MVDEEKLTICSMVGEEYSLLTGQLLAHVFNHGTHHRGNFKCRDAVRLSISGDRPGLFYAR